MHPDDSIYQRRYTVEEYFALEEQSDIRHEYYQGEIFPLDGFGPEAMAGATFTHNTLKQNCVMALRQGLRGSGCRVFDENVRLTIEDFFTYPDVLVTCHPADRAETRTVRHPVLIIEVLSGSTEGRDRGWKFQQYQRLLELQQYVLVSQNRVLVESFVRTGHGTWELTTLRQPDDVLLLIPFPLRLPLTAIYEDVDLPPLRLADA
ncbi:Uma2 family endonuclease [Hymenobacter sp. BT664]|uniref:Uma2 family endonuclease n=1 Tax=Hymenobacter montanus TaxID=2771359 RepID=A0A927BBP3_9BACT|nr:Uma2 family endonuclease [Hymenobacter montanus]MBD2767812.1 Uma2 family endonuclease [Hymenobacter montanus]